MKRLAIITASLLTVLSGWNMSAQTSKYGHGEDSLNCLKYLSFYTERFKKDEKDPMALSNWRQAYKYCPATASENIFVNGTKMMTNLYRSTKNAQQRAAIADTILMLQDQRLAAYPKKKTTINLSHQMQMAVSTSTLRTLSSFASRTKKARPRSTCTFILKTKNMIRI